MTAHIDLPTLSVRARGLSQHLFARGDLERLAGLPDAASLARGLSQGDRLVAGFPGVQAPATAGAIESAVRQTAAHHLARLAAWAPATPALDLFFGDQERRSLRALLRGAMEGAPPEARLAGLIATPGLPERALAELARAPTPAEVATHLVVLRHPDATRLLPLAKRAQPSLFDLEMALLHGFAGRAGRAARTGDRNLRAVVHRRLDALNVTTALIVAGAGTEVPPSSLFVDGGARLTPEVFVAACRATSRAMATTRLLTDLGHTPLDRALRAAAGDPVRFEREAFVLALAEQRRGARLDPLGSAPLTLFLLRLEAQSMDVRRLAWGVALGAPAGTLSQGLVTPWS